jgi:hypothetical protein
MIGCVEYAESMHWACKMFTGLVCIMGMVFQRICRDTLPLLYWDCDKSLTKARCTLSHVSAGDKLDG